MFTTHEYISTEGQGRLRCSVRKMVRNRIEAVAGSAVLLIIAGFFATVSVSASGSVRHPITVVSSQDPLLVAPASSSVRIIPVYRVEAPFPRQL